MEKTSNFSITKAGVKQYSEKNADLDSLAKLLGIPEDAKSRAMIVKTIEYQHSNIEVYFYEGGTKLAADVLSAAAKAKLTKWEEFTPFLQSLKA